MRAYLWGIATRWTATLINGGRWFVYDIQDFKAAHPVYAWIRRHWTSAENRRIFRKAKP